MWAGSTGEDALQARDDAMQTHVAALQELATLQQQVTLQAPSAIVPSAVVQQHLQSQAQAAVSRRLKLCRRSRGVHASTHVIVQRVEHLRYHFLAPALELIDGERLGVGAA